MTTQTKTTHSSSLITPWYDLLSPGYYLDGWADLVEDRGNKAAEIREDFVTRLKARNMPGVWVSAHTFNRGKEQYPYTITVLFGWSQTLIYIDAYGPDLFVSWKTFIKPMLDKLPLQVIAVVAGVCALVAGNALDSVEFALVTFVMAAILLTSIVATAGRLFKGSFAAYFFFEPSIFVTNKITSMSLAVHKTLLRALNSAGIQEDVLRLKRNFSGGRRGESI